jgi:RNA polymerase-binding transcription factor DksA
MAISTGRTTHERPEAGKVPRRLISEGHMASLLMRTRTAKRARTRQVRALRIKRTSTVKKSPKLGKTHRKTKQRPKAKATTLDILGAKPAKENVRAKWRKYFNRLATLRADLINRTTNRSRDAIEERPSFSTHMADAGTDSYDRDFSLGMLSFEQDAVLQIDQAIARIRAGTYGICELTGKPIEQSRLEAIPWTRFSAAAEKQMESEGAFKGGRIGDRRSVTREEAGPDEEESDEE